MNSIRSRRRGLRVAVGACALVLAACGSTTGPSTLEDLGLAIAADVQQGASFEVAVPAIAGTTITVSSAPSGVNAAIAESADGSLRLSIVAGPDTPAGTYNLGLTVLRNGEEQVLGLPFDVVPSDERDVSEPGAVGAAGPEALRDALVEALVQGDAASVRPLWPSASWESVGATIVGSFVPRIESGDCERTGDASAHCFVFAEDDPFVLGLTMERQGIDSWVITSVGYDSTN